MDEEREGRRKSLEEGREVDEVEGWREGEEDCMAAI
jgi:hypothetical protein